MHIYIYLNGGALNLATCCCLKLFYICYFQFVVRTTNYVVLVICQADASLSKIVPKVEWFTLHRDFSCECLNNMATTVESTPSGNVCYSRDFLLTFANFRSTKPVPDDIYKYIQSNVVPMRRRRRRVGVQRRLGGNKDRLPLPSIMSDCFVYCTKGKCL